MGTEEAFKLIKQKQNDPHLGRLHVEHLGDTSLHDEEVWIVDVQLNGAEQVLNPRVGRITSVDQVLVAAPDDNLLAKHIISTDLDLLQWLSIDQGKMQLHK